MRSPFHFYPLLIYLASVATAASCASGNTVCGNQICESGETALSCPKDCGGAVCGNGTCESGENVEGCATDCYCGNATCDLGEDSQSCPDDCASAICGDGVCGATESISGCPADCYCGNTTCDTGESSATCPGDCPASCGNGTCDAGETQASCPQDCGTTAYCGDGNCDVGETSSNCPQDCPSTCGNGTCDAGETYTSCPADCPAPTETSCTNGVDDDSDGQVDCQDSDCTSDPACQAGTGQLSCLGLNSCYGCCPSGDNTCYTACDAQGSTTGVSEMQAYLSCASTNCASECSGTDTTACNSCVAAHCQAEQNACDWAPGGSGGCWDLDTCLAACPTSPLADGAGTATTCPDIGTSGANSGLGCLQSCTDNTSPTGYSQYMAILDCISANCNTECYGGGSQTDCTNCQQTYCSAELNACS